MTKTIVSGNVSLFANKTTGLATNNGLFATQGAGNDGPLPEPQDAVELIYDQFDFDDRFSAIINVAAGTYDRGLSFSGRARGIRTPGNLRVVGAGRLATTIKPTSPGVAGAEINYGAAVSLEGMGFDMTSVQDAIITGKDADFSIRELRFANVATGHNCITLSEFMRMTVTGNLWIATDCQCFLQLDQNSSAYWNTNGVPNLICIWLEWINAVGRYPAWASSFIDAGQFSSINIQNIDYNAWKNGAYQGTGTIYATGNRVRSRPYSVIDLNTLGVASLPGSSNFLATQEGAIR